MVLMCPWAMKVWVGVCACCAVLYFLSTAVIWCLCCLIWCACMQGTSAEEHGAGGPLRALKELIQIPPEFVHYGSIWGHFSNCFLNKIIWSPIINTNSYKFRLLLQCLPKNILLWVIFSCRPVVSNSEIYYGPLTIISYVDFLWLFPTFPYQKFLCVIPTYSS